MIIFKSKDIFQDGSGKINHKVQRGSWQEPPGTEAGEVHPSSLVSPLSNSYPQNFTEPVLTSEVCQTRKVKCSGLLPCSRCVELDIDCLYKDPLSSKSTNNHPVASGRTVKRQQTSTSSRSDLGHLVRAMRKVCDDIESSTSKYDSVAISHHALKRSLCHGVSVNPRVSRPTPGYVALLSRAQGVLHEKGLIETSAYQTRVNEPATDGLASVPAPVDDLLRAAEPIIHLGQAEALRYLAVFKDHVYSAYPCINLDVATKRLTALYSARAPPGGGNQSQDLGLDIIDVELMKATLAIAMMLDGEHDAPLCRELDAHLLWNTDFTMNEEHAQVEDVIMATLLVGASPSSMSFSSFHLLREIMIDYISDTQRQAASSLAHDWSGSENKSRIRFAHRKAS